MSSPRRKAARNAKLEELAALATEIQGHEDALEQLRPKRDVLLLEARAEEPRPSLRDLAAIGRVSHAWVRKLERREGGS